METVVTGIAAGVISGYLGVLLALKQFKAQRAFDRQLEWYERTLRAVGTLSKAWRKMAIADKLSLGEHVLEAQKEVMAAGTELAQCAFESILYGDQEAYDQLYRMTEKSEAPVSDWPAHFESVSAQLCEMALELSRPMRKMLGLRTITPVNFKI